MRIIFTVSPLQLRVDNMRHFFQIFLEEMTNKFTEIDSYERGLTYKIEEVSFGMGALK